MRAVVFDKPGDEDVLHIADVPAPEIGEGEVVAVGPGKRSDKGDVSPLDVKAGDKVLIGKYAGNEVKIDDQELVIIREDEVLAVIE